MKRAYLAISYSQRHKYNREVAIIKEAVLSRGIELLVFVDQYDFNSDQEHEMMEFAFQEIDSCDFLISELTTKSIGVGIEIGYAVAKKIPVVYLRRSGAEHSTTASGSAMYSITYENEGALKDSLQRILTDLANRDIDGEQ